MVGLTPATPAIPTGGAPSPLTGTPAQIAAATQAGLTVSRATTTAANLIVTVDNEIPVQAVAHIMRLAAAATTKGADAPEVKAAIKQTLDKSIGSGGVLHPQRKQRRKAASKELTQMAKAVAKRGTEFEIKEGSRTPGQWNLDGKPHHCMSTTFQMTVGTGADAFTVELKSTRYSSVAVDAEPIQTGLDDAVSGDPRIKELQKHVAGLEKELANPTTRTAADINKDIDTARLGIRTKFDAHVKRHGARGVIDADAVFEAGFKMDMHLANTCIADARIERLFSTTVGVDVSGGAPEAVLMDHDWITVEHNDLPLDKLERICTCPRPSHEMPAAFGALIAKGIDVEHISRMKDKSPTRLGAFAEMALDITGHRSYSELENYCLAHDTTPLDLHNDLLTSCEVLTAEYEALMADFSLEKGDIDIAGVEKDEKDLRDLIIKARRAENAAAIIPPTGTLADAKAAQDAVDDMKTELEAKREAIEKHAKAAEQLDVLQERLKTAWTALRLCGTTIDTTSDDWIDVAGLEPQEIQQLKMDKRSQKKGQDARQEVAEAFVGRIFQGVEQPPLVARVGDAVPAGFPTPKTREAAVALLAMLNGEPFHMTLQDSLLSDLQTAIPATEDLIDELTWAVDDKNFALVTQSGRLTKAKKDLDAHRSKLKGIAEQCVDAKLPPDRGFHKTVTMWLQEVNALEARRTAIDAAVNFPHKQSRPSFMHATAGANVAAIRKQRVVEALKDMNDFQGRISGSLFPSQKLQLAGKAYYAERCLRELELEWGKCDAALRDIDRSALSASAKPDVDAMDQPQLALRTYIKEAREAIQEARKTATPAATAAQIQVTLTEPTYTPPSLSGKDHVELDSATATTGATVQAEYEKALKAHVHAFKTDPTTAGQDAKACAAAFVTLMKTNLPSTLKPLTTPKGNADGDWNQDAKLAFAAYDIAAQQAAATAPPTAPTTPPALAGQSVPPRPSILAVTQLPSPAARQSFQNFCIKVAAGPQRGPADWKDLSDFFNGLRPAPGQTKDDFHKAVQAKLVAESYPPAATNDQSLKDLTDALFAEHPPAAVAPPPTTAAPPTATTAAPTRATDYVPEGNEYLPYGHALSDAGAYKGQLAGMIQGHDAGIAAANTPADLEKIRDEITAGWSKAIEGPVLDATEKPKAVRAAKADAELAFRAHLEKNNPAKAALLDTKEVGEAFTTHYNTLTGTTAGTALPADVDPTLQGAVAQRKSAASFFADIDAAGLDATVAAAAKQAYCLARFEQRFNLLAGDSKDTTQSGIAKGVFTTHIGAEAAAWTTPTPKNIAAARTAFVTALKTAEVGALSAPVRWQAQAAFDALANELVAAAVTPAPSVSRLAKPTHAVTEIKLSALDFTHIRDKASKLTAAQTRRPGSQLPTNKAMTLKHVATATETLAKGKPDLTVRRHEFAVDTPQTAITPDFTRAITVLPKTVTATSHDSWMEYGEGKGASDARATCHVKVDFANKFIGGGAFSMNLGAAQEEMSVLQDGVAATLAAEGAHIDAHRRDGDGGVQTRVGGEFAGQGLPTPVYMEGEGMIAVPIAACLAGGRSVIHGAQAGLDAELAAKDCEAKFVDYGKLSIAAPRRGYTGHGRAKKFDAYGEADFRDLFAGAYTGFRGVVDVEASKTKSRKVAIETGGLGAGDFGHDLDVSIGVQYLAARCAGVDSIQFNVKGHQAEADAAVAYVDKLLKIDPTATAEDLLQAMLVDKKAGPLKDKPSTGVVTTLKAAVAARAAATAPKAPKPKATGAAPTVAPPAPMPPLDTATLTVGTHLPTGMSKAQYASGLAGLATKNKPTDLAAFQNEFVAHMTAEFKGGAKPQAGADAAWKTDAETAFNAYQTHVASTAPPRPVAPPVTAPRTATPPAPSAAALGKLPGDAQDPFKAFYAKLPKPFLDSGVNLADWFAGLKPTAVQDKAAFHKTKQARLVGMPTVYPTAATDDASLRQLTNALFDANAPAAAAALVQADATLQSTTAAVHTALGLDGKGTNVQGAYTAAVVAAIAQAGVNPSDNVLFAKLQAELGAAMSTDANHLKIDWKGSVPASVASSRTEILAHMKARIAHTKADRANTDAQEAVKAEAAAARTAAKPDIATKFTALGTAASGLDVIDLKTVKPNPLMVKALFKGAITEDQFQQALRWGAQEAVAAEISARATPTATRVALKHNNVVEDCRARLAKQFGLDAGQWSQFDAAIDALMKAEEGKQGLTYT